MTQGRDPGGPAGGWAWLRETYRAEVGWEACQELARAAHRRGPGRPQAEGLYGDLSVILAHVHEVTGGSAGVEYATFHGIALELQVQLLPRIESRPPWPLPSTFSPSGAERPGWW